MRKFFVVFRFCIAIMLSYLLVGCATGASTINDLSMSISDLQRVVTDALPLGKRTESRNGREFYSNYFLVKKGEYEEALSTTKRNFAVITILGDRRPYQIEVVVIIEHRNQSGEFSKVGYDTGLARVITRRIQKTLHERRDNRNIIDDFRVF